MTLTLNAAKRIAAAQFRAAGLPSPGLDARILLGHAAGLSHAQMIAQGTDELEPKILAEFEGLTARRILREPVDHILGQREFYGRAFKISKDVLSPRPETEMLIDAGLALLKDIPNPRILDLGTGSGAIALTLLAEIKDAGALGVDISQPALSIAKENADLLGVSARARWHMGSWFDGVENRFDLIVSNPPYITDAAMAELAPEVSGFDPALALSGGADGLGPYRAIISKMGAYMKAGGAALFEIGYDQKDGVLDILKRAGFNDATCAQDLGGHERMIKVRNTL